MTGRASSNSVCGERSGPYRCVKPEGHDGRHENERGIVWSVARSDPHATRNRVQQSPPEKANPNAETRARAMLYQAVWETSQFCDFDEIRRIVEGTLHNIAGDEP